MRLLALLESLHDGIVVQDGDGVIVQSNPSAHRILGLTADQMSRRTSTDSRWRAIHEDGSEFPGETHPAMVTLATGEPVHDAVMGVHKPDGSLTWIMINSALLPPSDGVQVVTSFTDVTELRQAEQRFQLLAENSSDFVYRLDGAGVIEWVSPNVTVLLGWLPSDWVGHNRAEFTHPDDIPDDPGAAQFIRPSGRRGGRVRLRAKDGSYRWLEMSATDAHDATGQVVGEVGSARDIDEAVRLETELARASAQLGLVLDNTADVVGRLGADGTLLWISPSIRTVFGWEPSEIVGTPFRISAPQSRQQMQEALARAVREHTDHYSARLQVLRADGELRWAEANSTLVWTDSGELDSVVVELRDVTGEVTAQQQTDAAGQRYRALVAALPDPTFVFSAVRDDHGVVTDLRYTHLNDAAAALYGREPKEIVGRGLLEVFPSTKELGVFDFYLNTLVSGEPGKMRVPGFDESGVAASFDLSTSAVGDEVVVVARDITESLAAEQELAASEQQYRLLAENASDLVYTAGSDRIVTWVSASVTRTLGWLPEELVGTVMADLLHPEDRAATDEQRDRAYAGHEMTVPQRGFLLRFRTKRGVYRWMNWEQARIADDDERSLGVVASMHDVDDLVRSTERVAAEQARLRATMDSLLDPHAMFEAVRDDDDVIVDFVCVDLNYVARTFLNKYLRLPAGRPDLVGAGLFDLSPGPVGVLIRERFAKVVEYGRPLVLDDYPYDFAMSASQRRFDIRAVRVGEQVSVTWRDVTDRHAAAGALAAQKEQYQLLAENASDVVFQGSNEGVLTWLSPSVTALLGWAPQDMVGHPFVEFVHPEDRPQIRPVQEGLLQGRAGEFEARVRTATGGFVWVSVFVRPVFDASGAVVSRSGGWRNIQDAVEARTALAESEQRYRMLAENASDMVWQLDTAGVIRWMSPSSGSASGWCPEQLLGTVAFDLIHPQDQPVLREWRDQILAGSSRPPLEARMRTAHGDYRWTSFRTQRTVDADGVVTGRVVGLRDVHEQVLAQRAVDVEKGRLQATMDSLLDPHVVFEAVRDDSGRIVDLLYTDANDAACSYNGVERDALVGAHLLDLLPGHQATGLLALYSEVVDTGEPLVLDDFSYELELLSGQSRYFDIRAVRVGDGLSYTWRDVTDRHSAAAALAAAEYQYHLVAENATDAVFLVNSAGAFTWVSPSVRRVLGYDPQDLVGMETSDLVHPQDLPVAVSMVIQVQHGTQGVHWEVRIRTASMDYRWMSAVSSPAFDPDGAPIGRITTLRDIHDQVLNRQALARSEQTFRLAMDGAPQGMAVVGLHGLFHQVNATLCELVGYDRHWMNEHTEFDLIHPDDVEADLATRDRLLAGQAEYDIHEGRLITATGDVLWVQHSLALIRDEHDMPVFYVSQYQDITDARTAQAVLAYKAEHDALTGLINREQLQTRLFDVLARTPRRAGVPALLFCDLDHFKTVNDTMGHGAGDYVLREAARRISSVLRDTDEVARLGGDEFVVVLPEVTDLAAAVHVAHKTRSAVAQRMSVGPEEVTITMSVGIAMATPGIEPRRLLRNADAALYEAKTQGRDRAVTFI